MQCLSRYTLLLRHVTNCSPFDQSTDGARLVRTKCRQLSKQILVQHQHVSLSGQDYYAVFSALSDFFNNRASRLDSSYETLKVLDGLLLRCLKDCGIECLQRILTWSQLPLHLYLFTALSIANPLPTVACLQAFRCTALILSYSNTPSKPTSPTTTNDNGASTRTAKAILAVTAAFELFIKQYILQTGHSTFLPPSLSTTLFTEATANVYLTLVEAAARHHCLGTGHIEFLSFWTKCAWDDSYYDSLGSLSSLGDSHDRSSIGKVTGITKQAIPAGAIHLVRIWSLVIDTYQCGSDDKGIDWEVVISMLQSILTTSPSDSSVNESVRDRIACAYLGIQCILTKHLPETVFVALLDFISPTTTVEDERLDLYQSTLLHRYYWHWHGDEAVTTLCQWITTSTASLRLMRCEVFLQTLVEMTTTPLSESRDTGVLDLLQKSNHGYFLLCLTLHLATTRLDGRLRSKDSMANRLYHILTDDHQVCEGRGQREEDKDLKDPERRGDQVTLLLRGLVHAARFLSDLANGLITEEEERAFIHLCKCCLRLSGTIDVGDKEESTISTSGSVTMVSSTNTTNRGDATSSLLREEGKGGSLPAGLYPSYTLLLLREFMDQYLYHKSLRRRTGLSLRLSVFDIYNLSQHGSQWWSLANTSSSSSTSSGSSTPSSSWPFKPNILHVLISMAQLDLVAMKKDVPLTTLLMSQPPGRGNELTG